MRSSINCQWLQEVVDNLARLLTLSWISLFACCNVVQVVYRYPFFTHLCINRKYLHYTVERLHQSYFSSSPIIASFLNLSLYIHVNSSLYLSNITIFVTYSNSASYFLLKNLLCFSQNIQKISMIQKNIVIRLISNLQFSLL